MMVGSSANFERTFISVSIVDDDGNVLKEVQPQQGDVVSEYKELTYNLNYSGNGYVRIGLYFNPAPANSTSYTAYVDDVNILCA